MTREILIILSCVPLYAVNSFCDKLISAREDGRYNYFYNALKFLVCTLCMLPLLLFDTSALFSLGSVLCGTLTGIMYALSKTVMLKGYEKTSVAFMTLCHSSGMILPCILGHFLWGERLSALSVPGVMLAILSIVLLKGGNSRSGGYELKGVIYGMIIFLCSAGVMISQKLMGIYFSEQGVAAYNFYSFILPMLIVGGLVRRDRLTSLAKNRLCILLCALGSAVSLSVISLVMTALSGSVPSVLLFPLFNGTGIMTVCIISAFAFKERLTAKNLIGLVLGIIGLCLVNF